MFRRPRPEPLPPAGFTLVEICVAMIIAVLVLGVAIPSLTSVMSGQQSRQGFTAVDNLAQEAHRRAMDEHRAYVLIWSPKKVVLRPDEPASPAEAEGVQEVAIGKQDKLELFLPASLLKKGKTAAAIWTFWPSGVCEPARITSDGSLGRWTAVYNAFTGKAEVRYE
jgi:type II secretory pathway pseudopilin PulG